MVRLLGVFLFIIFGLLNRFLDALCGLQVKFSKSYCFDINLEDSFFEFEDKFLNMKVISHPFKYLGFLVGVPQKKEAIWEPLVCLNTKRLTTWKNIFVSLGGRVMLLNLILSVIHVFLFLHKMRIHFWQDVWKDKTPFYVSFRLLFLIFK